MQPIVELLAELVRRPSINPMGRTDIPAELLFESRVTDYLEACFREIGVPCERQVVAPGRENIIARYVPSTPAPFTVLWEAHQDTVPVDGMIVEPFGARIENGRLYGRGSCDVKGGIAYMFSAFARLVKEKPKGSAAVTLAFTVDEEHTFLGVQHLMQSGVRADGAIVAEPTGLEIVRTHKGVVRWQIETAGVACHSSRPDNGVNAVYRMARLVQGIETYAKRLPTTRTDPLLGPPTLSLGVIQGGVSPNTVPDYCRVEIDRRLIPGEDATAAVDDVEVFLKAFPGVDFSFAMTKPRLSCPPLSPKGSEALIERLGKAIDTIAGPHRVVAVPYGTDASTIAEAGVPAVVFGPGDIAQAHTKDEWIDLDQLEQAAEILYHFATDH